MRKLMEWGKFPATSEAAELRMEGVPKRLERVKSVKMYMIAEDLYLSMMDAAQAIIMYVGAGPPVPKTVAREMRKHLVSEGLLDEKYAKMMEDMVKFRKAVEHKEVKAVSGKELDKWIDDADDFVKKMEELLTNLQTRRKASDIEKSYEVMIKASVAALKAVNRLPEEPEKLPEAFGKYLVEPGLVSPFYAELLGKVLAMRKLLEEKKIDKITERDVYMNKEYVRKFVVDVRRVLEEKGPLPDLEKDMKVEEKMEMAKERLDTARDVEELPKLESKPKPAKEKRVEKVAKEIAKEEKKHHEKK